MLKSVKSVCVCVSFKWPLTYPRYQLTDMYSKQFRLSRTIWNGMSTSVWLFPRHPSVYTLPVSNVEVAWMRLIVIYFALVRSVLEYCCVVWHNALPAYLSSEKERVPKRALRMIYHRSSYQEALQRTKIARFEDRRNELWRLLKKLPNADPCQNF